MNYLFLFSILTIPLSILFCIYCSKKNGYVDRIQEHHYKSLFFYILSGIFIWAAIVLANDNSLNDLSVKDWMSLVFSIIISILTWARLIYVID